MEDSELWKSLHGCRPCEVRDDGVVERDENWGNQPITTPGKLSTAETDVDVNDTNVTVEAHKGCEVAHNGVPLRVLSIRICVEGIF